MQRFVRVVAVVVLAISVSFSSTLSAETFRVSDIEIVGNERIDVEAIRVNLDTKPGNVTTEQLNSDLKKLYQMGYFDQVTVTTVKDKRNKDVIRFKVVEKPVVRKIFVKGNDKVSEDSLGKVLSFGEERFIDKNAIEGAVRRGVSYYQSQGYYDATIEHSALPVGTNEVDVTFEIDEGERYRIRKVSVSGLDQIDEDELTSLLRTTRYKWWSSWLFGTGRLSQENLDIDKSIIRQYLLDHGFIEGSVGEPAIEKKDEGLYVAFDVKEGNQYTFGQLEATGDLIDGSIENTLEGIRAQKGEIFNASYLREDALKISDKFGDIGYAFANVVPQTQIDRLDKKVDIIFESTKGKLVTVDRINITGNSKTYDNVIRRELKIQEQETYSGKKVRRSQALLQRLGYFEEVDFATEAKEGEDDKVDLDISVREGATGSFSAGAGFSSSDGLLFNSRLSENNFLGTGKRVVLNVDIGSRRNNIIVSYQDRRFRDTYWSLGVDGFKTEREFSDFDRELTGASLEVGYPLEEFFESEWLEDINFSLKYEYLSIDITEVNPDDAAPLVLASEGTSSASGLTPRLIRNTIDNPLNPTKGSRQVLSFEVTGPGGNEEYYLADFRTQWYYPLIKTEESEIVFSWRFRAAYGDTFDDGEFPLFRRFFPGGINSVRGFQNRTLGPKDEDGNEFGGSKMLVNNLEFIFPLVSSAGLRGVAFFDIGEAFDDSQSIVYEELRQAYGYGIRWISPLGPIRIEFGFPLDREEGEDSMVTLFSFGAPL